MYARALLAFALSALSVACGGSVAGTPTGGGSTDASTSDDGSVSSDAPVVDTGVETSVGCAMPGMCVLVPKSCCGFCGQPTPTDEIALPRDRASSYRTAVCAGTACPDCAGMPDPNLQAFCVGGSCVPVDLRTNAISGCASDGDCEVAWARCCGTCTPNDLVAVEKGKTSELLGQICDPRIDCAMTCGSIPPAYSAYCDPTTKHCVLAKPH